MLRIERFPDRVEDAALRGQGTAGNPRARRGGMSASTELVGDVVDVDLLAFRAEADPRQTRLDLFKKASDDDTLNAANR